MTLDCSRIAKEIAMFSGFFVREGGRHWFILESDKNEKDQKKSLKQTSRWLPQTEQQTNGSKSTNHKPWPFEFVQVNIRFLEGPLKWLTEQKNPKFLRTITTIFGEQLLPFYSSDCSKFLYCWLWFRPTQTSSKHFSAWFSYTNVHVVSL